MMIKDCSNKYNEPYKAMNTLGTSISDTVEALYQFAILERNEASVK